MVIPRRAFTLTLLTGLTSPRMLHAQSAKGVARIGFLAPGGPGIDSWGASVETFRQALRELGWVDGQNLVIDVRYAEGRYDRLPDLAAELVALKPDVIFAGAVNSAKAAKRATTTIPIVMETLGDAVSTGLVTNLARPGGNITGVSGFAPELSAKRLELLREILPSAARVALLANLSNPGSPVIIRATESAARQMRVQIRVVDVRRPTELDNAFDTMARLKPGLASYSRIAYGRELLGQTAGAIQAMRMAVDAATSEREPTAWTHWQLGKLYWSTGKLDAAEHEYRAALAVFPGYVYALDALAQVEAARGHTLTAISLALFRRYPADRDRFTIRVHTDLNADLSILLP